MPRILGVKLLQTIGIFFLGELLIEETMRLAPEPHASEAGYTSAAVVEKGAIGTGVGENTRETVIGVIAIRTLDTPLGGEAVAAIHAVFAIEEPIGVQKRFRVVAAATQIAIARFKGKVAVIAVFAFLQIQRLPRNDMEEIAVLFKERAMELNHPALKVQGLGQRRD